METCTHTVDQKTSPVLWLCFYFLRISTPSRRCSLSKRILLIWVACCVYMCVFFSQIGHWWPQQNRRLTRHQSKSTRGLYSLRSSGDETVLDLTPVRSNVLYITMKPRRVKPAILRGTVRPKSRRKPRRTKPKERFAQKKSEPLQREEWKLKRTNGLNVSRKHINGTLHNATQNVRSKVRMKAEPSGIRIYSESAPPWFSQEDIRSMHLLADGTVTRIHEVSHNGSSPVLLFESTPDNDDDFGGNALCRGRCGVIKSPLDTSEVFAFHLDRVLGLNRSLPAVCRTCPFVQDGQLCPVLLWESFLSPGDNVENQSTVRMMWGEYQRSLKQMCWHKNVTPKPDSGCSSIHHYEWSKLALFDFLLQIYSRLDRNCCGFRPRQEDVCVELGHHQECGDKTSVELANIIHRGHDPRHLVFTNNKGFFDRGEDNLDYKLLEGIEEFPEQAVEVLSSRRLRERLLQSLFLDQLYWESQGGRQGIEKLIDVIERRAQILLTHINAHGLKVVPMNV
ncbi:hypothetical protein DPEC_G00026090 [Dallia pectoralis]|uniref:Uncharacterized protein n=1 Tax=Dallia pectoralis TaxID=75939 RepID=A0ACC2HI84_DALPE|nr:hypothetical protein DPEC_G00026090 [Dallia pectoralis]